MTELATNILYSGDNLEILLRNLLAAAAMVVVYKPSNQRSGTTAMRAPMEIQSSRQAQLGTLAGMWGNRLARYPAAPAMIAAIRMTSEARTTSA
ncbi:MAG: hypothetical protein ACRDFR_08405 [Candidatus Limnocylindria bacterium]